MQQILTVFRRLAAIENYIFGVLSVHGPYSSFEHGPCLVCWLVL